jgi:hypothetical protein
VHSEWRVPVCAAFVFVFVDSSITFVASTSLNVFQELNGTIKWNFIVCLLKSSIQGRRDHFFTSYLHTIPRILSFKHAGKGAVRIGLIYYLAAVVVPSPSSHDLELSGLADPASAESASFHPQSRGWSVRLQSVSGTITALLKTSCGEIVSPNAAL